jgi:CheY-like chemotaxis protein
MERRQRILVVEDEEPIARMEVTFLTRSGYETRVARDGEEALAVLVDWTPDLILADVMMPKLDGYALCRAFKVRERWRGIPFIHVTADAGQDTAARSREAGADDLLFKPFTLESVRRCLRKYLPPPVEQSPAAGEATAG